MHCSFVTFCGLVLFFLTWNATCDNTYDIPVSINAVLQDSVARGQPVKMFYDKDEKFYSTVTVADAAKHSQQSLRLKVQKSIRFIFLTVASSHVSKTLAFEDLLYKTPSKWSYTVNVSSILQASQGTLTKINEYTIFYKIQENAMKVLEQRFQFESEKILNRLKLDSMDYYAVDEKKWIDVVGIIVEKVISQRSETLKLTTCYLAEMINRTTNEIQGFTLNEVDTYLYNTSMLLGKLPDYRSSVMTRLYQVFNITPTALAKISNTELSKINNMILSDVLKLFTDSVLAKLRVTKNEVTEKDPTFDAEMLLSCTDKWVPFKSIIIPESFHNSAETMAIEVDILAALIDVPYSHIQLLTVNEIIDLLETVIDPLSKDKKLVEATFLSNVLKQHGSDKADIEKDNVFDMIYRFTNLTKRQLTILYDWTSDDFMFSSMFTLNETDDVCSIDALGHDLLALAKLTVGQVGDMQCKSFSVLREIWERKSLNYIKFQFQPDEALSLHKPISMLVSELTKAPSEINYRVLNATQEAQQLIEKLSINNITAVSTYSSSSLQEIPFQDIIGIVVHLKRNGSFDQKVQVTSQIESTSTQPSTYVVSSSPTTMLDIPEKPSSTLKAFSNIQSSTIKTSSIDVLSISTVTSSSEEPREKLTTISNQVTSTITTFVQPSSVLLSTSSTQTDVPRMKPSSLHLSSSALPTPPMTSQPSKMSISLPLTSITAMIESSPSKAVVTASSIQTPAAVCQPECQAGELCILRSSTATCNNAQNLEGTIRITNGATFNEELLNQSSDSFQTLANQIQEMIDSIYQSSKYLSHYLGSEVIKFKKGSVIVFFKISFGDTIALSANKVEEIEQVLKNNQDANFTIDNSGVSVQDFDECSSGKATKCYKTATCNNTLGSYKCICPDGMDGDGFSCKAVNNSGRSEEKDVPWIIYVVIAIMVVLIIFLIVVIIYCEKKHKKTHRPQVLDFYNGGVNMYPRSTSYLAQTPESEADLTDGLGIVNRHGPSLNMVTFNPTPEDKKELELQKGQPGVFQYRL